MPEPETPEKIEISVEVLFECLDKMSHAPMMISEHMRPDDFKDHKWEPFREEMAEELWEARVNLFREMWHQLMPGQPFYADDEVSQETERVEPEHA